MLADLIRQVTARAWFATVPHPAKPSGWDITWGAQVDPEPRHGPPFITLSTRVTLYSAQDVRRWPATRRIDPERVA